MRITRYLDLSEDIWEDTDDESCVSEGFPYTEESQRQTLRLGRLELTLTKEQAARIRYYFENT